MGPSNKAHRKAQPAWQFLTIGTRQFLKSVIPLSISINDLFYDHLKYRMAGGSLKCWPECGSKFSGKLKCGLKVREQKKSGLDETQPWEETAVQKWIPCSNFPLFVLW